MAQTGIDLTLYGPSSNDDLEQGEDLEQEEYGEEAEAEEEFQEHDECTPHAKVNLTIYRTQCIGFPFVLLLHHPVNINLTSLGVEPADGPADDTMDAQIANTGDEPLMN